MKHKEFLLEVILISVNFYDDSIIQKLKFWTEKTDVTVYNVDESNRLLEVLANKTNDKNIKLPIISLRRPNGFTIKNPNKKPLSFDGLSLDNTLQQTYDSLKSDVKNNKAQSKDLYKWIADNKDEIDKIKLTSLNAIPISIPYTLYVYTRYQRENDLYMRNLIFNFINYPTFQVKFNYNSIPVEHNGNIIIGTTVSNVSDSIKLFSDQLCIQSIDLMIDDAYLWDTRLRAPVSISSGIDPSDPSYGSALEIYDIDRNEFIIEHF